MKMQISTDLANKYSNLCAGNWNDGMCVIAPANKIEPIHALRIKSTTLILDCSRINAERFNFNPNSTKNKSIGFDLTECSCCALNYYEHIFTTINSKFLTGSLFLLRIYPIKWLHDKICFLIPWIAELSCWPSPKHVHKIYLHINKKEQVLRKTACSWC